MTTISPAEETFEARQAGRRGEEKNDKSPWYPSQLCAWMVIQDSGSEYQDRWQCCIVVGCFNFSVYLLTPSPDEENGRASEI